MPREGFSGLVAAAVERKRRPYRDALSRTPMASKQWFTSTAWRFEREIVPLFKDRAGRLCGRGFNDG